MHIRSRTLLEPLAYPHGVDRYLDLVRKGRSLGNVRAEVTRVERQTADTVTIGLRADRRWGGFRAGQHVQVTVEIHGVRHTRCFSLAGSARTPQRGLELTLKAHATSTVSKHLREHARPGLVVGLSQAAGDFTLPPSIGGPLVLISAGSGITPVLSMLRTLHDDGHRGPVAFVHYARSSADVLYRDEINTAAALNPNARVLIVAEGVDGRFRPEHLDTVMPGWTGAATYLCGPPAFMDAVTDTYEAAGALEQLHVERFTLTLPNPAATAGGRLRFGGSRVEVADDGRSVLEQAEAAGLSPTFGCRLGICHTCIRRLDAGCVTNAVTGERTAEPGTPVRICVSVADGDVTIDL